MRRITSLVVALLSLGLLTGCSNEPAYSVFGNPQVDSDEVTLTGLRPSVSDLDPASTRVLGGHNGQMFYVARGAPEEGNPIEPILCLVVVPDTGPTAATSACSSSSTTEIRMEAPSFKAILIPDSFDASTLIDDGWIEIHQNLLAR